MVNLGNSICSSRAYLRVKIIFFVKRTDIEVQKDKVPCKMIGSTALKKKFSGTDPAIYKLIW